MKVGILKEIKKAENRVCMTPAGGVEVLADRGHKILVESNAGLNSGFANQMYLDAGASIADEAATFSPMRTWLCMLKSRSRLNTK